MKLLNSLFFTLFSLLLAACNSPTPAAATATFLPAATATGTKTPALAAPSWTATATQRPSQAPTLTATPRLFTPAPTATLTFAPEPLPDWFGQSWIAFAVNVSFASEDSSTSGLALIRADGTNLVPLMVSETEFFIDPQWSPDGHWLGYLKRDRLNMYELYITYMDGTRSSRLTYTSRAVEGFTWSPDGEYLVVVIYQPKETTADLFVSNLHLITRQGEYVQQLTTSLSRNFAPTWSADGSLIYFLRNEVEGPSSLYEIRPDGTGERKLLDLPGQGAYSLQSDYPNNRILAGIFLDSKHFDLFWLGLNGVLERITDTAVCELFPAVSPDRKWVAYWPDDTCYGADRDAISILHLKSGTTYTIGKPYWQVDGISWSPVPALQIGAQYQITGAGDELNLRQSPKRAGGALMVLHTGDVVTVLEGPVDQDDYYWWRLRTADGTEGWAVEVAGWYAPAP